MSNTSNTQAAKQTLAELLDEQQSRTQAAQNAQSSRTEAMQRLSHLRATQALDNVDLSKRIAKAEQDIAKIDELLATWPDVQAELARRVQSAKQAVIVAGNADMLAELAELQGAERGRRLAFAEAIHNAAQCGHDLRLLLDRKSYLRSELYAAGMVVSAGDLEMGNHPRFFGEQTAIDEARRLIDEAR
jgi:multidrug efflux pump subunit AcrA (membrane-fusion protein)